MIQTKERKKDEKKGVDRRIPFRSSKRVLDRPKRNEEEQVLRPPGSCLPPGTPRHDSTPRPVSSSSMLPVRSSPRFLLLLLLLLLVVLLPANVAASHGDICTYVYLKDAAFKPRLRKPCNSAATWLMSGGPATSSGQL